MRHLTITEYGHFLGVTGQQLQVRHDGSIVLETPLSRLRSIAIARDGVSMSSKLILSCAQRGIRLFVLDWRGINVAALSGQHHHAIAALRRAQFNYLDSPESRNTAAGMIYGKLRNQRAVLLYFHKYFRTRHPQLANHLSIAANHIEQQAEVLGTTDWLNHGKWREQIMGHEGSAASAYWKALTKSQLLPESFVQREGRGAIEVSNQSLNYGYTLLTSYIWCALDNAGFEVYAGILHSERAGKPSLVLDMMEEYRPWVVDRNIIKLRHELLKTTAINITIKKRISNAIHQTMRKTHLYRKKRLKLETILQRQAYRLAASVVDNKRYYPFRFKW
jgi:CRISPR-associated protein Cas1